MSTPEGYSVLLSLRARREARRLDRQIIARIAKAIDSLSENPRPPGCLKVKTKEGYWRIRVGDWRIGYEIDDVKREITIIPSVIDASFTIDHNRGGSGQI